jgi:hypothetical protein
VTVRSSTTLIVSTARKTTAVSPELRPASRLVLSASASNTSPLWNVTSGRSLIVHSVKSSLDSIDSARYGSGVPSSVIATRGSKIALPTM